MLKKLLLATSLFVALSASPAYGAEPTAEAAPVKTYYLEIEGLQRGISPTVTVKVNLGRVLPSLLGLRDQEVANALRHFQFSSVIDAVNFFASRGWEVDSNYVTSGAGTTTVHTLMRRSSADPQEVVGTILDR